jgi:hypothetical protein
MKPAANPDVLPNKKTRRMRHDETDGTYRPAN